MLALLSLGSKADIWDDEDINIDDSGTYFDEGNGGNSSQKFEEEESEGDSYEEYDEDEGSGHDDYKMEVRQKRRGGNAD